MLLLARQTVEPPVSGVAHTALERLRKSPYAVLQSISCSFQQGVIVLHGQVPSFYYKQLAQEAIAHIEGVVRIVNNIEVTG